MNKIIVDEDEFLALCNQELRTYPDYEEGMEIIGVPEGYQGSDLSGNGWKGPASKRGAAMSYVSKAVKEKYKLRVTVRT